MNDSPVCLCECVLEIRNAIGSENISASQQPATEITQLDRRIHRRIVCLDVVAKQCLTVTNLCQRQDYRFVIVGESAVVLLYCLVQNMNELRDGSAR